MNRIESLGFNHEGAHLLDEIIYKPGSERVAHFPSLEGKVKHGFLWGSKVENMSLLFDSPEVIVERTIRFLSEAGLPSYPNVVSIAPVYDEEHYAKTDEIKKETLYRPKHKDGSVKIPFHFAHTKEREISIAIKPADCNISIITGLNKNEERILAMVHSSWQTVNFGLPERAGRLLIQNLGILPETADIGITPAIGPGYTIEKDRIKKEAWGKHLKDAGNGLVNLDLMGATIKQLSEAGFSPDRIHAYTLDFYQEALAGRAFSNQLANEQRSRGEIPTEGRIIVAAALP